MVILPFQPEILQVKNIDDHFNNNNNNNHSILGMESEPSAAATEFPLGSNAVAAGAAALPVVSGQNDFHHGFTKSGGCESVHCNMAICQKFNNTTRCYCTESLTWLNETEPCNMTLHNLGEPNMTEEVVDSNKLSEIVNKKMPGNLTSEPSTNILSLHLILQILLPVVVICIVVLFCVMLFLRKMHRKHYQVKNEKVIKTADSMQLLDRMNVINKNPSYYSSYTDSHTAKKFFVREIPVSCIKLLDLVGEGAFGQVFKGEMTDGESPANQVAVKVLKEEVSNEVRKDFEREVEIMSAFEHDNILKLLGIVIHDTRETPYMIFEYMTYGDLAQVLRKNDPQIGDPDATIKLNKMGLIDIGTQIASGMCYLSSQHFVHRDLATRNCLVGEGLTVKISDFGMSRDIYTCDYYKIGGSRMLPVRWMSPESVKYGRFTSESDVWAYGVVLWEIFSYGKQPYYGHSNEEVLGFLNEGIILQRPDPCPSTIFNIMMGCWKQDPRERLNLKKIHKYLVEYSQRLMRTVHMQQTIDWDSEKEVLT